MGIIPRIDRDACTGTAACAVVAPKVFEIDDEGIAVVVDPNGADEETLWEAAERCPWKAVILEDGATERQVYP
jgi:ferredoxin